MVALPNTAFSERQLENMKNEPFSSKIAPFLTFSPW
jgi:hypothetical protein